MTASEASAALMGAIMTCSVMSLVIGEFYGPLQITAWVGIAVQLILFGISRIRSRT